MIWVAGRSPTLVSYSLRGVAMNLKATTLTYLAIAPVQTGGIPTEPSFSILDLGKFCPLHMEYFMGAQTIGSQHRTHLTPLWMVYLFPPVRNFCVRVCSPADRWE